MAWPATNSRADFVAAVAARSVTGGNTYQAIEQPAGSLVPGSLQILKNGSLLNSVYWNMGAGIAATDANPTGTPLLIFYAGGVRTVLDPSVWLNTLR